MKRLLLLMCCISFILSCSHKNKVPNGILPQKEMGEVLWDLVKAGEFLDGFVFVKDTSASRGAVGVEWYDQVFRLHKTTKADFTKSYEYYRNHPELMKEVLDSLGKKQFTRTIIPGQAAKPGSLIKKDTAVKHPVPLSPVRIESLKGNRKRFKAK